MKEENYYCTSLTDAIDYLLNQKSVGIEKKGVLSTYYLRSSRN